MIRILFDRKSDREINTFPGVLCPDLTSMFRYESVADGESQPSSLSGIFGGKEGIKELIQVLLCNGWSSVRKGEDYVITLYSS